MRLAVVVSLLVVALFGIAWIVFGPRKIDPTVLNGPYQITLRQNNTNASKRTSSPDSPNGQTIANWLTANSSGWRRSFTTYVPHHTIETNDFDLNIHPTGLCILNIKRKGQLTRKFTTAELGELLRAIGAE